MPLLPTVGQKTKTNDVQIRQLDRCRQQVSPTNLRHFHVEATLDNTNSNKVEKNDSTFLKVGKV